MPLESHNAADKQTGSLGDLEITLIDDDQVVTSYEMKAKQVTKDDIDIALDKIVHFGSQIHNYIFITTQSIDREVMEYAASLYGKTGGIEIVVLDCLSFLRYFLHLFYRVRIEFLEAYQTLILSEPESAVSQPLKEAFLAMRHAAESNESECQVFIQRREAAHAARLGHVQAGGAGGRTGSSPGDTGVVVNLTGKSIRL